MSTVPKLLTIADLTTRWKMSRQGIHDKKNENSFPNPIQYVANGRTALYLESDIEAYEQEHPWISSPARRERRQRFIFNLINK